ncbi:MAG TPA: sigma-70 family RNA polymerase sigma factor [Gaiellaceae bacterium]|nr:sigma-70 family RNA polymerase sigma factor [Gaiellaceae bacterium]
MRPRATRDPLANPEPLIQRVYSYAAYRLGAGPDAEDVTSEVFERALRYRGSYDPTRAEPIAWLLGIAQRCANAALTARAAAAQLPEHVDAVAPGNVAEEALRRIELGDALGRLSERDQELIALRFGADLTAKQIAAVLELRTNAAEVALHRALDRLRSILTEDEQVAGDTPRTAVPGARAV